MRRSLDWKTPWKLKVFVDLIFALRFYMVEEKRITLDDNLL